MQAANTISADIRSAILDSLRNIERAHDVTILYACESGSRAWGFASPDSDYDVRFVYVHKPAWYLTVDPGRDVIELPITTELDINGWELRKALRLLRKSNGTLLEWLHSPIVYQRQDPWVTELRDFAYAHYSLQKGYSHYLSRVTRTFRESLTGAQVLHKKYFYALRPLMAALWIERKGKVAPMNFHALFDAMVEDGTLRREIKGLLEIKSRARETESGPRLPVIHDFIVHELERTQRESPEFPDATPLSNAPLDDFLYRAAHAF